MRRRIATLTALAGIAAGLTACGGAGRIIGDWFRCEDAACTRLDDDGLRFDGSRWAELDAPGGTYDPGRERYVIDRHRGSYTLEGDLLTMTRDGSSASITARVDFAGDGEMILYRGDGPRVRCVTPVPGGSRCADGSGGEARRYLRVAASPPSVPPPSGEKAPEPTDGPRPGDRRP